MAKPTTHAKTNREAFRIEMKWLFKEGYIQKGAFCSGTISWHDTKTKETTASVSFRSVWNDNQMYLELIYTHNGKPMQYKIYFEAKPSNLGKGQRYYFLCPKLNKRTSILYLTYDSDTFICREAYHPRRIYYYCQIRSKIYRNTNIYEVEKELENAYRKQKKRAYKGKPTRSQKKIDRLYEKLERREMNFHETSCRLFGK